MARNGTRKSSDKTEQSVNRTGFKGFVKKALRRYFIDALGAMALGLFASLIIGLIIKQVFQYIHIPSFQPVVDAIIAATAASSPVVGASIGAAIAYGLKSKPLAVYSAAVAGAIGYAVTVEGVAAGPVGAYVAAIFAAEIGNLIGGKTKLDILLVPATSILAGATMGVLIGPPVARFMIGLGEIVNELTTLRPFPMGIAVSAVMGIVLTLPISSAALSIMLGLSGLAAGAATAGCCAHMVGFAVASYRENKVAGLVSQGIGTSMLQMPNIMLHPQIAVPAIIASMVTGPLSTMVFKMENIAAGAGMGTSGLVGQFTTWTAMSATMPAGQLAAYILLLHVIIPAAVALLVSEIMRARGWIKSGDMKLAL
ncbi:MAG: PTS sugar transporter subunit IIC [Clostridia bacterium]|nr:PTS sugar transporter subunit IIC [Clostridia bacterium]